MTEPHAFNTAGDVSRVPPIPKHAEVEKDPSILNRFNAAVVEDFRANGGKVGGPFVDSDVVLVTMTGAKSGQMRLTPLEYFIVEDRFLIVATRGGAPQNPAWVHNLRTHPRAHVEVDLESYPVIAHEITGNERDAVFAKVVEMCPRINTYPQTDRVIPVFELRRV